MISPRSEFSLLSLIWTPRAPPPRTKAVRVACFPARPFIHLPSWETLTQGDCLCIHERIIIGLPHPQLALHHSHTCRSFGGILLQSQDSDPNFGVIFFWMFDFNLTLTY